MRSAGILFVVALLAPACTSFSEDHFFGVPQSSLGGTGVAKENYFRVRVKGRAALSSARYVSGYYDERAVDLFFNEVKASSGAQPDVRPLFVNDQKNPGTDQNIKPLDPDEAHGVFVMIFSTNAKVIADVIGQFAENQVVADAITNLVNRDTVRRLQGADPQPIFEREQAKAVAAELERLMGMVPTAPAAPKDATLRAYLRVFNLIARAQGRDETYDNFAEAAEAFGSGGN